MPWVRLDDPATQPRHAGDGLQRPLRSRFQPRLRPALGVISEPPQACANLKNAAIHPPVTQYDITAAIQLLEDTCSRWITWENTKAFANSSFFTSLAGALAGAFAGAYAAQRVAERSKLRDELMRELRATNAALSVAFSVVSSVLSVKKQHIKGLRDSFVAQRTALEAHHQKRATGQVQGNAPYEFQADFRSIPELTLPLETLELVFGRLSVQGRALSLVAVHESVSLLNGALARRNTLIEKFRHPLSRVQVWFLFTSGFPTPAAT